jgi:hypothetical protein
MQAEYSADIVFKRQKDLPSIYGEPVSATVHSVKPDNISTFLERKLSPLYQGETGTVIMSEQKAVELNIPWEAFQSKCMINLRKYCELKQQQTISLFLNTAEKQYTVTGQSQTKWPD